MFLFVSDKIKCFLPYSISQTRTRLQDTSVHTVTYFLIFFIGFVITSNRISPTRISSLPSQSRTSSSPPVNSKRKLLLYKQKLIRIYHQRIHTPGRLHHILQRNRQNTIKRIILFHSVLLISPYLRINHRHPLSISISFL